MRYVFSFLAGAIIPAHTMAVCDCTIFESSWWLIFAAPLVACAMAFAAGAFSERRP